MINIAFENVDADKLARLKAFSNEQGIKIVSISNNKFHSDFDCVKDGKDDLVTSQEARQTARQDFFGMWQDVPLDAEDVDNLVRNLRKNRFQEMFDAR